MAATPRTPSAPTSTTSHEGFHIKDVTPVEWISWTPMLVLIVALGVFPNLLFRIFDPAVTRLVDHLGNFIK